MVYPLSPTLEFMAKGLELPVLTQHVSHSKVQMVFPPMTTLSELQL